MKRSIPFNLVRTCFLVLGFLVPCFLMPGSTRADTGESDDSHRFDFGFDHRARFVDFDNIIDYDDNADDWNEFYRFRTRLWGCLTAGNVEFKLQLANEFRRYNHPHRDDSLDEAFIDLCYLTVNNIAGSGWSITAGRQNIMRGNGFLFFDGSPLDGSRSTYFNALVFRRSYEHASLE
ncbi:hypothetical protein JXA80_00095, partial [bacterium]|nr:hypothetical protein [candidate division CSSED10-310 bacterium]